MTGLAIGRLESPVGLLFVVTDADGVLHAIDWPEKERRLHAFARTVAGDAGVTMLTTGLPPVYATLRAYFDGALDALDDVPVQAQGSPFQCAVWAALRDIPVGQTVSYGAIAAAVGQPSAARAVGLANGANPVPIVVPCHRVIGSTGSLTGFGGGLDRKLWLLRHERATGLDKGSAQLDFAWGVGADAQ